MGAEKWSHFLQTLRASAEGSDTTLLDRLSEATRGVSADVYWYPGSGEDLMPMVFDTPHNPMGRRLFRLNADPRERPVTLLWMTDHADWLSDFPSNRLGTPFHPNDYHEMNSPPMENTEIIFGQTLERYRFSPEVPITLFTVTVRNRNQGIHSRPHSGDCYLVLYSACPSHILFEQIFLAYRWCPVCVALIRQGGFSMQHENYGHYQDLPRFFRSHHRQFKKLVETYIIDAEWNMPRDLADYVKFAGPVTWGTSDCYAWRRIHRVRASRNS